MAKFNKGPIYNSLVQDLAAQTGETLLNVHVPGTGGTKYSEFPTCLAISKLKALKPDTAAIYFEGVGSAGADYIAPLMTQTHTLENQRVSPQERLFASFSAASSSEAESVGLLGDKAATAVGVAAGAGKKANTQRLINTLRQLQHDNHLPEVVHLSGHSRGAINCIDMANKIYQEFGGAIKIHLTLTDPVPGPGHWHDVEEKALPPNVVSCNIFYADSEGELFLAANDATTLVATNSKTTLNYYAIKDSDHGSVLGAIEVHEGIQYLTYAINGVSCSLNNFSRENMLDKPEEMRNKSMARWGSNFHAITPINDQCNVELTGVMDKLRNRFGDFSLNTREIDKTKFTLPAIESKAERKRYVYSAYREAQWQRSHISYGEMLSFLLIVPTLGLSANLYRTNQQMTAGAQLLNFAVSLGSLNIAPSIDMALDTGKKLAYNIAHKGLFRPALAKKSDAGTINKSARDAAYAEVMASMTKNLVG